MRMFMEEEHIRKLSFKALSAIKQKRRGGSIRNMGDDWKLYMVADAASRQA